SDLDPRPGAGFECVRLGLGPARPSHGQQYTLSFLPLAATFARGGRCGGDFRYGPEYNDVFPLESFMQFQPQGADQRGVQAMEWRGDSLRILDHRRLPEEHLRIDCNDAPQVAPAIRDGAVQGPASVGIAAAYGIALAARRLGQAADWSAALAEDFELLAEARPSAEPLTWALRMLQERLRRPLGLTADVPAMLVEAALGIHASDSEANRVMAKLGMQAIRRHDRQPQVLMTFGHAGALSGSGRGGVLGVIQAAHGAGLVARVDVCESRPGNAGLVTHWELQQYDLPAALHADAVAAHLMKEASPS